MNILKIFKHVRGCVTLVQARYRSNYYIPTYNYQPKNKWSYMGLYKPFAAIAAFWPLKKSIDKTKKTEVDKKVTLLDNADDLFKNGNFEQCYTVLLSYENGNDVEVSWRIVRALYNMAKEAKSEHDKKELIMKAYKMIKESLKTYSDHFAVHKWYALLLDAKSGYEGTKQRITQLEKVKQHMEIAARLNPNDATTLYMLGEWCYQVTDMPWYQRQIAKTLFATPPNSTYSEALEFFLKAEAVEPRFYCLNLLMIGKCYLKLGKPDQAKYYLNLAASYPAKSNDDHQANKEAAELLKKLK